MGWVTFTRSLAPNPGHFYDSEINRESAADFHRARGTGQISESLAYEQSLLFPGRKLLQFLGDFFARSIIGRKNAHVRLVLDVMDGDTGFPRHFGPGRLLSRGRSCGLRILIGKRPVVGRSYARGSESRRLNNGGKIDQTLHSQPVE